MHRHVLPQIPLGRGAHLLVQNPCVRIKHIYGLNSSSATQILFRSKPGTCYHRGRNTIFISTGGRSAHANTSGPRGQPAWDRLAGGVADDRANDVFLPLPLRPALDRVGSQLDRLIYDAFLLPKAG